jgi:hypothetical protein
MGNEPHVYLPLGNIVKRLMIRDNLQDIYIEVLATNLPESFFENDECY